uniref:Uncharacterized protein n=1 Tax=Enterobacter cloacae TaxID=550 RepID=A0A2L1KN74_ENTCL|nr:hypothetical protein [Enterobacter cloacae]
MHPEIKRAGTALYVPTQQLPVTLFVSIKRLSPTTGSESCQINEKSVIYVGRVFG